MEAKDKPREQLMAELISLHNEYKKPSRFLSVMPISPVATDEKGNTFMTNQSSSCIFGAFTCNPLQTIFEHSMIGIAFHNLQTGHCLYNPAYEKMLGYTAEELKHLTYRDFTHPEDLEYEIKLYMKAKETKIDKYQLEKRYISKDGATVWVRLSCSLIRNSKGESEYIIAMAEDINERKKIEEQLRSEKESLKANKLKSISILAGGIAHDFNNILTAILGNISLAKVYAGDNEEISDVLAELENASVRARDLTQQLLTFARGGLPVKNTASIAELIKESSSFILRGSSIKCEYQISEYLWPAEIDKGQINQVINNLIINAQQAMPQGGSLLIKCENKIISSKDNLPLPLGEYIKITIKDTGIGISKENLPRIFDPYFTTKEMGSGLGLAISYSIILKHSGHISVESELESGTTFEIYLPASEERLKHTAEEKITLSGSGKILVMDDEVMVREIAAKILRHIGYKTELSADGTEAIRVYVEAMTSGQPFDAVIMDLTIPGGMGGKEGVKKLLELDPGAKAIVSSGYSNDTVMSNYKEYGFSGVIVKPFNIAELSKVLNDVLNN